MSSVEIKDLVTSNLLDLNTMVSCKGGWQFGWILPYSDGNGTGALPPQAAQYITQYITETTNITNDYQFINIDVDAFDSVINIYIAPELIPPIG